MLRTTSQGKTILPMVFDKMLVEWLAVKYLPFSFFEDQHTQNLFKALNHTVDLPKRNHMRQKVMNEFEEKQNAVMSILKENTSKFSFTTDGWTSVSNKSYYGITCHFISKDWKLQSLIIDFVPSNGKHTGKDIATIFFNSLHKYGLEKKIQGITVDNAAANTTFISELANLINEEDGTLFNREDQHFRCFAHILNLAVQDLLKLLKVDNTDNELEVSDEEANNNDDNLDENAPAVPKIRSICSKLKRSEKWQKKFENCCELTNLKVISLPMDVSTRWNSTFDLLKVAIKMQPAINALCDNNEELKKLRLSENEWAVLKEICRYLQNFKTLSTTLGGEEYVTLPMVILGFNMLLDKLECYIEHLDNKIVRSLIDENILLALQSARDKLVKHYRKSNWIYCAVLILDPRHKVETFKLTKWGREMLQNSVNKFENIYKNCYYVAVEDYETPTADETSENSENDDAIDLNSLFENNILATDKGPENYWRLELDKYLSAKRATKDVDVLDWWRRNQEMYPNLALIARDFLGTTATSVPSERLFSKASLTIRKHRNRLNSDSARSLLCLNSWATCRLKEDINRYCNNQ